MDFHDIIMSVFNAEGSWAFNINFRLNPLCREMSPDSLGLSMILCAVDELRMTFYEDF